MPAGRRDPSYLLFRSISVVLTGNCFWVSPTPGRSCLHGAHFSFTYVHPMSRYIVPKLLAVLTRACAWQKLPHWSVKPFGGLISEHVQQKGGGWMWMGTRSVSWQGPGQKGQGRGLAAMQRSLIAEVPGESMVGVLLWSRKGQWGFGTRRRKRQKLRAGKKL